MRERRYAEIYFSELGSKSIALAGSSFLDGLAEGESSLDRSREAPTGPRRSWTLHSGPKSPFDAHNTRLANIKYIVTNINHLYSASI